MPSGRRELVVSDCLDAVARIDRGSVALVYLDPPFSSGRTYDLVDSERGGHASEGRTEAFDDQWRWTSQTDRDLQALSSLVPSHLAELVSSLVRSLGRRNLAAYLVAMAPRLVELHRVLDERGSLYLHCDSTASHYLRVILDEIFGPGQFRNEIVWRRTHAHSSSRRYGPVHDVILFYSKTARYRWNPVYTAYPAQYLDQYYTQEDERGRFQLITCTAPGDRVGTKAHYEWKGLLPPPGRHWAWKHEQMEAFDKDGRLAYSGTGTPRLKRYVDEAPGIQLQDIWTDINRLDAHSDERVGFETQKPLALIERIIQASSNPGDLVLDPFVGSGSTLVAAERSGRNWIGVDASLLAGSLALSRVRQAVSLREVSLNGFPEDEIQALQLRRKEPLGFGLWATSMLATLAQRSDRTRTLVTGTGRLQIGRRRVELLSWVPTRANARAGRPTSKGRLSKTGFVVMADRNGRELASRLRKQVEIPIHEVPVASLVSSDTRRRGVAEQVRLLT
ncbi:site-specific DNA-methyltransferase [Thermoleophilia bacterium SCSIO 60948]|nr:site-specific DNA-methyltransferase [Thermoleophilia bacterium SCSIO 60948]